MKISTLSYVFSLVALPSLATAQPSELETITVTATRSNTDILSINSNLGWINEDAINQTQQEHINQLMVRIPGVWISRGNGQEHLTAIRSPVLTGAGGCGAFLMAQDGISLRGPAFCNTNQLFDTNAEQAAQVEVLRGPGSTLYGTNAVHGVINVLTPDPLDDNQNYVGFEAGPHDYLRGKTQYSHRTGQQAFMIQANLSHDGGYKEESGADQQKVSLLHQYESTDLNVKSVLSVTNLNQETAGFVRGFKAYEDPELKTQNPNPEAFRDSRSARAYSIIDYTLDENSQIRFVPYLRWADMQFLQHFLPWQSLEKNDQRSMGLQTQYVRSYQNMTLLAGLDLDYTIGNLQETQDEPFSPTIPQGSHYDYQVKASVVSPFIQLNWDVTDKLNINAGTRYEVSDFDYENFLSDGSACEPGVTGCRFSRPEDQSVSYNDWSYQIGGHYKLANSQRIYSQLSTGFRAPQATELFRLQAGQTVTNLEAEKMTAIELGLRGQWHKLFYDVSIFSMDKDNFIFQDTQRQNISNGETEHYGIEISLHKQLTEQAYFRFNATLAKHRYKNNLRLSNQNIQGNEIDTAPQHIASAHLGWKWDQGHFVETEYVHQGNYFLDPANTAEYEGHNLLNLRASYQLSDSVTLHARVINLLDKDYAERADFAFGSYRYFVGEPRSLFVGFRSGF